MKKNPAIPIIDGLVSKAFYDRHHTKNLAYDVMEKCIAIAEKENPEKPPKKVGKLKVNDEFVITLMASELRRYKVIRFLSDGSVYGERSNMAIAAGSGYYPKVFAPMEVVKKIKPKKEKLPKIKVGQYFRTKTVNTVYKADELFENGCVHGTNKLMFLGANSNIKIHRSHIIVVPKEDYKKQHDAEKTYKEDKNGKLIKVVDAKSVPKKSKKKGKKKSKNKKKKK